jgi:hypothetical protein
VKPPSIIRFDPVIYEEASLARKVYICRREVSKKSKICRLQLVATDSLELGGLTGSASGYHG